ncbi:hypothetical protein AVEN_265794-1 [Araneus ventricosus]|uniref:Uncharacterized protein n=1 Tax=Araneus ventricosus TaxID=182803 RepID=A0A4Y2MSD4_ARAVE|nr:hypothetical protein AVEN_265794-1 [Araneus ventricosus]
MPSKVACSPPPFIFERNRKSTTLLYILYGGNLDKAPSPNQPQFFFILKLMTPRYATNGRLPPTTNHFRDILENKSLEESFNLYNRQFANLFRQIASKATSY